MTGRLIATWAPPDGVMRVRTVAGVDADGRVLVFDGALVVPVVDLLPADVDPATVRVVPTSMFTTFELQVLRNQSEGRS